MALDRFVYWKKNKDKPTKDQVEQVIRDYLGEVMTSLKWEGDRFFVCLVGKTTAPLKSVATEDMRRIVTSNDGEERYIEVWPSDDCLDVMTRRSDEFTNNVADGLAKIFARFWQGRLEMEK